MSKTVKVGLIGAGFVSDLHAYAFKHFVKDAEIVAVAALEGAKEFAKEHEIPNAFDDYREMLKMKEIDVVTVAIPNYVHRQATVDAAKAGKHVICEKPLCVTLEEADEMIDACKKAGRPPDVCGGIVVCAQICARQNADRRRRDWRAIPGQAIRGTSRSAYALVLGCESLRRRRDAGHGLPFDRIHALGAGQAQGQERDRFHGNVRSPRPARKARIIPTPSSSMKAARSP